ncbi:DUF6236 family protein [uncultured Ferrimonas sp.]|uniref:DUF6236 family protein n=1 Tax=uncultured Ferrimonas sp. TaxID=432640 RepID=UPI002618423D|nr:DUF6236 family protein [uncultured Ferrimonas sp.]
MKNQGIIISPMVGAHLDQANGFNPGTGLSWYHFNFLVMYWDKVVIPKPDTLWETVIRDESELTTLGILSRHKTKAKGHSSTNGMISGQTGTQWADSYAEGQAIALNELIKSDKSHDWTVHQFNNRFSLPEKYLTERQSVLLSLSNCLPVPRENVAFHDILEFKEYRSDQLAAFRGLLENTYVDLLKAADSPDEQAKIIKDLKVKIFDAERVMNEAFKHTFRTTLSSSFNLAGQSYLSGLAQGVAAGAIASSVTKTVFDVTSFGIGAAVAAPVAIFSACAEIKKQLITESQAPSLAYLSSAHSEGIL